MGRGPGEAVEIRLLGGKHVQQPPPHRWHVSVSGGFDAGKEKGRKRQVVIDTQGRLIVLQVHVVDRLSRLPSLGALEALLRLALNARRACGMEP